MEDKDWLRYISVLSLGPWTMHAYGGVIYYHIKTKHYIERG